MITLFIESINSATKRKTEQNQERNMKKHYYGFRYFVNYSPTRGNTKHIAGELVGFKSLDDLKEWLEEGKEKLTQPTGLGGGKRERISFANAAKLVGTAEAYRVKFEIDEQE